ncbi:MAG: MATE family efflux transporter [Actinobacteria bacterium]|nr:MATE family efflux transporter [Actinomycetota bacterium]MBW3650982.1 MATE family efflux transporter [Actinomycetota bacterium]
MVAHLPLRHPLDREILRLAVPALGALAAEPLYILVDTAVVGHLGTPQLGGLAIAGAVLTTAFFLFNFLAYGTTAAVARLLGAGDLRGAAHQAVQGLWLAVAIGIGLALLGLAFAPAAVGLFGAGGDVREHAITYLRISSLGAPAVLVVLVGVGYLRGLQDTKLTLLVAAGSNVANLVLELVLIYGLGFGIGASAAATVVAQLGAAAVFVAILLRNVTAAKVPLRPHARRLRALVRVGRDLFVRTGSLLAALGLATAIASRLGATELAAHQIAFQLWSFLALVLDAIAIAGQAMIGRLLGAGVGDEARRAGRRMVQWGLVAGVVFAGAVLALRSLLVPLFTQDPAVAALARDVLLAVALLQPANAVVFVLDGVLIGAGDLRYLAKAMALSSIVVFAPAAMLVLRREGPLLALWGAIGLLMAARLVANAARFHGPRWQVTGAERA